MQSLFIRSVTKGSGSQTHSFDTDIDLYKANLSFMRPISLDSRGQIHADGGVVESHNDQCWGESPRRHEEQPQGSRKFRYFIDGLLCACTN